MRLNVVVDRDIKSSGKKDSFGNLMAGDLISSERMIYFRDDNPLIDAGGRFVGLPEKLPLSAKSFWDAFELGVKNSRTTKITNGFSNCTYSKGQYETTFSVTMNFLDTGLGPSAAILQFSRGIIIYVYTKEGAIAWPPGQPNTQGVASSVKMNGASFSGMHDCLRLGMFSLGMCVRGISGISLGHLQFLHLTVFRHEW